MQIGIIGTGVVGQTLGTGLVGLGHTIMIGSREPTSEKLQQWLSQTGRGVSSGTVDEAARFGEVIVLATKWDGTESALKLAGEDNLAGKVVIDVTNPLQFGPEGPSLAVAGTTSGGELIQGWLSRSQVVKALNIVPAAIMIKPDLLGETPDMFIAGNDPQAKEVVSGILAQLGWPVIDMGGIEEARLVEALGMLWIKHFFRTQNWRHAFKLIRQEAQA